MEWISVKERLPEVYTHEEEVLRHGDNSEESEEQDRETWTFSDPVLVRVSGYTRPAIAVLNKGGTWDEAPVHGGGVLNFGVTHWQPLPSIDGLS